MSYSTKPAFIHHGDWDNETRQHPALKFMEDYTKAFDTRFYNTEPYSKYMTDDHVLVRSTGQTDQGGEASLAALKNDIYAPFADYHHEGVFEVAFETEQGWDMIGIATLWWNLAVPGDGPEQKDGKGKEWEGGTPAAFKFSYRNTGDGIKISETRIMADPSAAMVAMVQRAFFIAIFFLFPVDAHLARENVPGWAKLSSSAGYLTWGDELANQYAFFHYGAFDPKVLAKSEKIKQPTGVGEILTVGSWEAKDFAKPVLVFDGEYDQAACESYCTTEFLSQTAPLFPAAKPFEIYIQPDTGHGMNLHYNATSAYKIIQDWIERNI